MNFLYVVLGLAMISGISAMMKVGNNINNLMLLSTFKETDYLQSSGRSNESRDESLSDCPFVGCLSVGPENLSTPISPWSSGKSRPCFV